MVRRLLFMLPISATFLATFAAATYHKEMQEQKERAIIVEAEFQRLDEETQIKEAGWNALDKKSTLIQSKLETTIIYCYSKPQCIQPDTE